MAFIEVENVVFSYEAEAEETESNQSKTVLKNLSLSVENDLSITISS